MRKRKRKREARKLVASSSIIEVIRRIAESEVRKMHIAELGVVTSVFPHSDDSDKDNYECSIKLKDKEVELRKVPVATQHIGLANILHVGDLVLVSFVNGDINSPIIIGRLYNDEDRPPISKEEEIIYKPPYSKNTQLKRLNIVLPESTVTIDIHDDRLSVIVGKSSITANSAGEIVVRSTKNTDSGEGSSITLDDNGISIDTDFDIQIHSKGGTTIECDGDLSFKGQSLSSESSQTMTIKSGLTMNIQSSDLMAIKSDALANIESTGPMTVKGAIINLNP
jgi:hypothetical protein